MGKSTYCMNKRACVQIPRTNVKERCGNTPLSLMLWELETRDLLRFTGHQPSGRLSETLSQGVPDVFLRPPCVHGMCTYTMFFLTTLNKQIWRLKKSLKVTASK